MKNPIKHFRRWFFSGIGIAILRLVSTRVSLATNQALGSLLARVVFIFKRRTRQVATINLSVCFPQFTAAERHSIMQRSVRETGKLLFELNYLWSRGASQVRLLVKEVEGEEIRLQSEAQGNVIFVTPHLGCWEIAGLYVSLDKPLYCLYKQAPFGFVDRFIRAGREAGNARLCLSNTQGVKKLLRAFTSGENILLLPDQVPPHGHGIHVPFFGHPAYTMRLLAKLAQRAPVVFTFAERLPRGQGYRICFTKPPAEIYDADLRIATAAVNTAVEALIRRCPQQYFWTYKRFGRSGTEIYPH